MNRVSRLITGAYGKPSLIRNVAVWTIGMSAGDTLMQALSKKDISDHERSRRMVTSGLAMGAVESTFCSVTDKIMKPSKLGRRFFVDLTLGTTLVITTFLVTYNVQLKEDFWETFARDRRISGYQAYMLEICLLPILKIVNYADMPRSAQVYMALTVALVYGVYLSYHKHCVRRVLVLIFVCSFVFYIFTRTYQLFQDDPRYFD